MEMIPNQKIVEHDHSHWANSKFVWMYAIFIFVTVVAFGFLLKLIGVYESMWLRLINIAFILSGFLFLLRHYKKVRGTITFVGAFILALRAGVYFCLLYSLFLLIFLANYPKELNLVRLYETHSADFPVIQVVFASYMETIATVVILALVTAMHSHGTKK